MQLLEICLLGIPAIVLLLILTAIVKNAHGPKKGRYRTTAAEKS